MICLTDLLATCAALTGQNLPRGVGVDSLNVLPALLKKKGRSPRDTVVQQGISSGLAIRKGDWKFIPANATAEASGIGSGANPKDRRFAEATIREPLLFNLAKDPGETHQKPRHRVSPKNEGTRCCIKGNPKRQPLTGFLSFGGGSLRRAVSLVKINGFGMERLWENRCC